MKNTALIINDLSHGRELLIDMPVAILFYLTTQALAGAFAPFLALGCQR